MKYKLIIETDDYEELTGLIRKADGSCPRNAEREAPSIYSRWFDRNSKLWKPNSIDRLMFLKRQEHYANELLRRERRLYLNEVYDMLGIPRTEIGSYVGWVYEIDNREGDNYVDFGICSPNNIDFINDYVDAALLDFNVDGVIIDR